MKKKILFMMMMVLSGLNISASEPKKINDESPKSSYTIEELEELPDYILIEIMNKLDDKKLVEFALLSKRIKEVYDSEAFEPELNFRKARAKQRKFFKGFIDRENVLNLKDKNIEEIYPGVFAEGFEHVTHLILSYNKLSSLDKDTFQGLDNLQGLYLANNQLSSLDKDAFQGLDNLQELYLDNNQLSSLDKDTFQGLDNLQRLYLDGNELKEQEIEVIKARLPKLKKYEEVEEIGEIDW